MQNFLESIEIQCEIHCEEIVFASFAAPIYLMRSR